MGRIAAIGEGVRVRGLALAGVLVLPADDPPQARSRFAELPGDVDLVILTASAAQALEPGAGRPLRIVMPP
jgi:vacuolar-type H+-ATPase subunit F/Vma7